MDSKPKPFLGPYGLRMGQAHHIAYLVAAIVMGSICLISTIITFIISKTENDLKQRGRYLVFWNGISATGVVTVYLMLNSFAGNFPCFLLLWTSYLCVISWLLTYLARGWRLVYIYNQQVDFGNRIIQRSSTQDLLDLTPGLRDGNGLGISEAGDSTEQDPFVTSTVPGNITAITDNITTGDTTAVNLDTPLPPLPTSTLAPSLYIKENIFLASDSTLPNSASTIVKIPSLDGLQDLNNNNTENDLAVNLFPDSNYNSSAPHVSQNMPVINGDNSTIDNNNRINTINRSAPMNFDSPHNEEDHRWNRLLPFNQATDGRLTLFLLVVMIIPLGVCIGMQFVKPSPVQINPTSYKCGEGAVFYPIYIVMLLFLAVGCPILIWKLWWIKDGFGIRNELLITMMIGLPGFVLYFVSPFKFKKLDTGHWNHVNWLVLVIFLAQVNSTVLPLIQFWVRQRPKQRHQSSNGSSKSFASILRWDSPRSVPGTPNFEIGCDTSSFHSQLQSPQLRGRSSVVYDSSIHERQSIAQYSIAGVGDKGEELNALENRNVARGERTRGMKGFWTKYGKDSNGEIIPLSKMNPRAFEYAIKDTEMLEELVKFSVTVFSVENTKFLLEYDGLKKQVQEYFKLTGYRDIRRSKSKHHRNSSDARSTDNNGEGSRLDLLNKLRLKRPPNFAGMTSSIYSRRSARETSDSRENSPKPSHDEGSITRKNSKLSEDSVEKSGDPGPSTGFYSLKSFGKHRQDLRRSQWRPSLHTSRSLNSHYISPYGPVQEEGENGSQQMDSSSNITSPHILNSQMLHQPKRSIGSQTFHSEITTSTTGNTNESRPESGVASERSSLSWYGRGNTGSSISYHDVTPSETDSYHGVGLDNIHIGYFDDLTNTTGHFRTDSLDYDAEGEVNASGQDDDGKANATILSSSSALDGKLTALSSTKDINIGTSESTYRSETRPKLTSGLSKSFIYDGTSTSEKSREGPPTLIQRRLKDPIRNSSPFHSPNSSISGTFSPRLPMQPQTNASSPIRQIQTSTSKNAMIQGETLVQCGPNLTHTSQPSQPSPPSSPTGSNSISSWSRIRSRSIPKSSTISEIYRASKAKFSNNDQDIDLNVDNGKIPVPKALLPAYWELYHTFIKPNSELELNLNEHHVNDIKSLFLNSGCFIDMYEPIFKEVQELVYSNVWPHFIQSIQRNPNGLPGRFKRSLNNIVGRFISDSAEDTPPGYLDRFVGWFHRGRVHDSGRNSSETTDVTHQGHGNQALEAMELGPMHPQSAPGQQQTSQAPYFHTQVSYLGLSSRDSALPGGPEMVSGSTDVEQVDLGQFGVMQELDFSALQHIVVDSK